MPGAAAERGLGFAGAKAKGPAGTRWGGQGLGERGRKATGDQAGNR